MPSIIVKDVPDEGPVAKRQRRSSNNVIKPKTRISHVFAPYRTVGLVSPTAVPFTALPLGKTTFQITTSVGRSLQTFDLRRGLNLVFITKPQTPGLITATASRNDLVYAAWTEELAPIEQRRKGIWIYKRGKKVDELPIPLDLNEDIVQIHTFGSWIIACCATRVEVWNAEPLEHYASLYPPHGRSDTGAVLTGGICSLPTYTNKILAGREDGTVEIWNVSTAKLLYTIQPPTTDAGPVTAMQPTPALSLVALAYMNGNLSIHDIHSDAVVIALNAGQGDQSPITSISFRTDGVGAGPEGRDPGVMATASYNSGDVLLWDLNQGGRKMGTLKSAHATPTAAQSFNDGGISKVEFLAGQPVIVTSGLDNSLKSWIFDNVPFSPVPRILHSRSGHAAPVSTLNFLPAESDGTDVDGKWLMSTSKDRSFWGWSLRRDGQSTELSQGSARKKKAASSSSMRVDGPTDAAVVEGGKASEITCLACSMNRDGGIGAMASAKMLWTNAKQLKPNAHATEQNITGWESVVTGHRGDKFARTWFWGRKRAGRWTLETGDGSEVTSVAMSPCGTFALVGSAAGGIDMYNLQSGLHRQRFPPRLSKVQAKRAQQVGSNNAIVEKQKGWGKGYGKHTATVTGLVVDNLNRVVISSSLDGKIKFWNFTTGALQQEIDWHSAFNATQMTLHRSNDLLAISCSDSHIRVMDITTRRIIRDLVGCRGNINDLSFSNDGRWIIAASSDGVLRVWDLPTGHVIDAIRLRSPCKAVAFSPTGEFLALAQEDSVGVDIWTNSSLFKRVPTRRIDPDDVADIREGPTMSGEGGTSMLAGALVDDMDPSQTEEGDDHGSLLGPAVDQLDEEMTTLSLVPKSRWQTLLHLDLIRERNRPKEAPKLPGKAPFFLSSSLRQDTANNRNSGINSSMDLDGMTAVAASKEAEGERSRIMRMERSGPNAASSQFSSFLRQKSLTELIDHLKTLPPSTADIEIRSLSLMPPYGELTDFVEALIRRLDSKRDYELVQAWMAVFLKCHGEVLQEALADDNDSGGDGGSENDNIRNGRIMLRHQLGRWRQSSDREARRLQSLVGYCSGVVSFLRQAR